MPRRKIFALLITAVMGIPQCLADTIKPDRAKELEILVLQGCGSCHGLSLKGGLGSDIRAETLAGQSPQSLVAIILDGIPGTAMPPWRTLLTEKEARWIADYLLKGNGQ